MSLIALNGQPEPLFTAASFTLYLDNQKYAEFSECTLPSLEIGNAARVEGGQNSFEHVIMSGRKLGRLTLKKGMTKEKEMLKWYLQALDGQILKAQKEISVVVFNIQKAPIAFWFFGKGIPVKWTGPTLKASESAIAIDTLEIAVHEFESIDV